MNSHLFLFVAIMLCHNDCLAQTCVQQEFLRAASVTERASKPLQDKVRLKDDAHIAEAQPNGAGDRTNQQDQDALRKNEERRIEGTWTLVGCKLNGEDQQIPNEGMEFIIKQGTIKIKQGSRVTGEGTFRIDPSKTPKAIDISNSGKEYRGKINLGIYELRKNELWMAISTAGVPDRPGDFSCKQGSGELLAIYKKVP